MTPNLKSMSEKELLKLRTDVNKALARIEKAKIKDAMKAADAAAKKFGYTLKDLVVGATAPAKSKAAGKKKGPLSPPKYANPADATQTWTGRGRQPAWIKDALAKGKKLESMEIKKK